MTHEEVQQLIKETVAHAKNVWGSEESKVAGIVLEKMGKHIDEKMEQKLVPIFKYIEADTERNKQKDEADRIFKEDIAPVIQMGKNVRGFGAVSLYLLGFIASISAGFYAIMNFINNKN